MATMFDDDYVFRDLTREPTPAPIASAWQAQLAHPSGTLGWVAGRVMALANRSRNHWVVDGLGLMPGELVLEIGAGPGVGLARAARTGALVVGVDHSEAMVAAARKKNRRALAEGRVRLVRASAGTLPVASESLDVVFSVDAVPYWDDLFRGLCEVRRVLRPGGRAALAVRDPEWGPRLVSGMRAVGFHDVEVHTRADGSTCVTGWASEGV